jgi:NTP pyrophosphatase (non-canonical NTP hydrolase)
MEGKEYQKLAMKTLNPSLTKKDMLVNGVMGLNGESGEVIDIVKKHMFQGHELDKDKIKKELGDVMWYVAEVCEALDLSLDEVMEGNIEKLAKRFKDGFTVNESINRKE